MKVFNEEKEAAAAELTRKPSYLLRQFKYISCLKNKKGCQLRLATAGMCLTKYQCYKSCPEFIF